MQIRPHFYLLLLATSFLAIACEDAKPIEEKICGCTESQALNYNPDANCNDGSCLYLDDDKKTLNTLFTSTGCGGCGVWGVDCHTRYSFEMSKNAIPFELHFKYGDPMINATSDSFVALAKPRYSPYFAVGLVESMDLFAENRPKICEKSQERAQGFINDFLEETPNTRIDVKHTVENGQIQVHFAIEAADFQGMTYAIYLLENDIEATQNAGWKNDVEGWKHQNVVRKAVTPVLGKSLKTSDLVSSLSIPIDEKWNAGNLYAVLVLWQPNDTNLPKVVNAEQSIPF